MQDFFFRLLVPTKNLLHEEGEREIASSDLALCPSCLERSIAKVTHARSMRRKGDGADGKGLASYVTGQALFHDPFISQSRVESSLS